MNRAYALVVIIAGYTSLIAALPLSNKQMMEIGQKIWNNECNGTHEGLTTWKHGEAFASLGIGHFIWFPKDTQHAYQETFPSLLKFMEQHGTTIPTFITRAGYHCPWKNRTEFYNAFHTPHMQQLRALLLATIELQIKFIMQRVELSLNGITRSCTSKRDKQHITRQFTMLASTPQGWYVIVDYINFKGEGIKDAETYQGRGWGLKHVLLAMHATTTHQCVSSFVTSAKKALADRVDHAPAEKKMHEQQWLKGWYNRLDTYLA